MSRSAALARAPMSARRAACIWLALAALACAVFVAALTLGSVRIAPLHALAALAHAHSSAGDGDIAGEIVRTLRLPRALAGFACGGLLALAGALLQVLLRNPLAEPYVLGVSGGAAVCAVLALSAGAAWWLVDAASFVGALLSIALLLGFARGQFRHGEPQEASPRLLLTGVMLATGWGAGITLLLTVAPDERLRGIIFWLTGDLNGAGHPWPALAALAVALAAVAPVAAQLNVLAHGEGLARALGVPTARLRLRIYLVASLAAAAAVTTAGTIGFIGLVVPHALRLAFGNDQRMLVPASALAGGIAVMGADLVARTIVAPTQLPVGVVTAVIGVPAFLWMLAGRRR